MSQDQPSGEVLILKEIQHILDGISEGRYSEGDKEEVQRELARLTNDYIWATTQDDPIQEPATTNTEWENLDAKSSDDPQDQDSHLQTEECKQLQMTDEDDPFQLTKAAAKSFQVKQQNRLKPYQVDKDHFTKAHLSTQQAITPMSGTSRSGFFQNFFQGYSTQNLGDPNSTKHRCINAIQTQMEMQARVPSGLNLLKGDLASAQDYSIAINQQLDLKKMDKFYREGVLEEVYLLYLHFLMYWNEAGNRRDSRHHQTVPIEYVREFLYNCYVDNPYLLKSLLRPIKRQDPETQVNFEDFVRCFQKVHSECFEKYNFAKLKMYSALIDVLQTGTLGREEFAAVFYFATHHNKKERKSYCSRVDELWRGMAHLRVEEDELPIKCFVNNFRG